MTGKDGVQTAVFCGAALVLLIAAFTTQPKSLRDAEVFDDRREPFYPQLEKAEMAKALEVISVDEETAGATPFRVEFKDNRWIIPSHYNYPADAENRLKQTAGAIIGLRKDSIVSDRKADHEELGVVDPLLSSASKGWGTRVTLSDKDKNVLADFIFGKDVPGRTGFKYVRVPDKDRVYAVEVKDLDLSTRFADWIDTNLLETNSFDMEKVTLKDYTVDRAKGAILDRGTIDVAKDATSQEWKVDGIKEKEETDKDKARDLTQALADIKINGIREKPASLGADLRLANERDLEGMIGRGFYPYKGDLVSDEGETIFTTRDGLVYKLRFGGLIVGARDEITMGKKDEKATKADPKAAAKDTKDAKKDSVDPKDSKAKENKMQENRFLLVGISFDESKFPPIPDPPEEKKVEEAKPAEPKADASKSPKDAKAKDEKASKDTKDAKPADAKETEATKADVPKAEPKVEPPKADPKEAEAKKKADDEEKKRKADELKAKRDERQKKIDDGKKKAKELSDRYAKWYYVIPNDTFKKIHLTRVDSVKEKKDEPKLPGAPGAEGLPSGGFPNLPPGGIPGIPKSALPRPPMNVAPVAKPEPAPKAKDEIPAPPKEAAKPDTVKDAPKGEAPKKVEKPAEKSKTP